MLNTMVEHLTITKLFLRAGAIMALLATGTVQAQPDVFPTAVDVRLVEGAAANQLLVQLKIHSTAEFGGILSALTLTIRYDAASGMSLGAGTSFCNAWSAFTPSPVVVNNGIAYRTYSGYGINRLEDPPFEGGCGTVLLPEQWFTITSIAVIGDGCTSFVLGNDGWTGQHNRNYYISTGGYDVTGQSVGAPVDGGACIPDCLGVPGGGALPGTPCDDGNPGTDNDTWSADCMCTGTGCVAPFISGTSTNSPVCSNALLSLAVSVGGTGPFTYAWSGSGTFSPDASSPAIAVTGAFSGTYQVDVTNACGSASASIPVTVQPAPSATISYGGSPFCATGGVTSVTRTGTGGGSYSASPPGLAVNADNGNIDLSASAPGSYMVTYSIAASGSCAVFSTSVPVTVTAAPSAGISYAGSPYCTSEDAAVVTLVGAGGGSYSASPGGLALNAGDGNINPAASSAGSYTVTYSMAAAGGCAAYSTTAPVAITEAPGAVINYPGSPYCSSEGSAPVTRTGTGGGTYGASPAGLAINGANGGINPSASMVGDYTVTYTVNASGGCSAFSTSAPVTVTNAPSASINYPGSPYCTAGGSANVVHTGTSGGSYSATPAGLSLNAASGNINLSASTAGSYVVIFSIAASGECAAFSTTAQVTLTAAASAGISYAGSPYCASEGMANVTRTGTEGGNYSALPTGLAINANSGSIDLGGTIAGTYMVTYTVAGSGGCAAFTASAPLTVTAAPSATITYNGSPYCTSGNMASVTRTGTGGGSYSATPAGLALNANTGEINLGNSDAGVYEVTYAVNATGGCAAFSTTAQVVVLAGPSAHINYYGSPYCGSMGTAPVIQTGMSGGTYSAVPPGLAINPISGAMNMDSSVVGTYTVTYTLPSSGDCGPFSTTAQVVVEAPTTWYADTDNDGAGEDAETMEACDQPAGFVALGGDLCPDDPGKIDPGVCGCGTPDTDADLDGIADCMDDCPALEGEIGDPCDDGDPQTEQDVITADCSCAGIAIGIAEVGGASGIGVGLYPNPCGTGLVVLDLEGFQPGSTAFITILDLAGRTAWRDRADLPLGSVQHAIALPPNTSPGVYLVQVMVGSHRFMERLVLQ